MSRPGTKVQKQAQRDRREQQQELRDRTMALIEQVTNLDKICRSSIRAKLIPPQKENNAGMDLIDQIRALDGKLTKCIGLINTLSKKKQPETRSPMIQNIKDELVGIEKELATLPSYEELNRVLKQKEFSALFQSIEKRVGTFKSATPPTDKVLEADWNLLQTHCNRWEGLMRSYKATTNTATAHDYSVGIEALSAYDKTMNSLIARVEEVQHFKDAVNQRDKRVASGKKAVTNARAIMLSDQFDQMKGYMAPNEIELLRKKIETVARAIEVISKKDYMGEAVKSKNKSSSEAMTFATKTCNEEVAAFTGLLNDLNSSFSKLKLQIDNSIEENLKAIRAPLAKQSAVITSICDELYKKLKDEGLDTTSIEKFKADLVKANTESGADKSDPVEVANKLVEAVSKIFKELKKEEIKQYQLITVSIQKRSEIVSKSVAFLAANDMSKYKLDASEQEIVKKIKSYQNEAKTEKGGYKKLVDMESALNKDVEYLKSRLKAHDLARGYIKNKGVEITKLIQEQLNQGNFEILKLMSTYLDKKQFIELLGDHLNLLNDNGLNALKSFLSTQDKSHTTAIQFKLDFIALASNRDIANYKDLLNDSNVIQVTHLLAKLPRIPNYITNANLLNKPFCNALLRCNTLEIPLTEKYVQVLQSSEDARSFVLNEHNSKEFIQKYLNADENLRKEFINLSKEVSPKHQSLLLSILLNESNRAANKVFLTVLLSPLFKAQDGNPLEQEKIRLMELLKDKNQVANNDLQQMSEILEGSNKHITTTKAQLEKQVKNLGNPKIAKLLGEEDVTSALTEARVTLTGLSNFQREVILVLLNSKSITEKQKETMALADKHFSGTDKKLIGMDTWASIKEFIGQLFKDIAEKYFTKEHVGVKNHTVQQLHQGTGPLTSAFKKELETVNPKKPKDDADKTPTISSQ